MPAGDEINFDNANAGDKCKYKLKLKCKCIYSNSNANANATPAGDKTNYDKNCDQADVLLPSNGWEPPEDSDEDTWSSELSERSF